MRRALSSRTRLKKASVFLPLVFAVLAFLLLLSGPATAQSRAATTFLQQAKVLQSRLDSWQKNLGEISSIGSPAPNKSLSNKRDACLGWIKTTRGGIAQLQPKPTVWAQMVLLSDVTYLGNALSNLDHTLAIVHVFWPLPGQPAAKERAQEEQVQSMRKELQGFYDELSAAMFQQLRAAGGRFGTQSYAVSHGPGRISGHVYRADTGRLLADAVVTLASPGSPSSDKLERTGSNGSYRFGGLAPGHYWVVAYRTGFAGSVYGMARSQLVSKGLISVAPGQKRTGIDLQLSPVPAITTLGGEALAKELTGKEVQLAYGPGSFSPDGKQFAFAVAQSGSERVCQYALASRSLKCVAGPNARGSWQNTKFNDPTWVGNTGRPAEILPPVLNNKINYLTWVGDILYAETYRSGGGMGLFSQVTPGTARPFAAIRQAFRREHDDAVGAGFPHFAAGNSRFTVTALSGQLAMAKPDGEDPYVVATGGKELYTFVFDPERSLVFYPVPGRYYGAIVSFNLNTRRYERTELPFSEDLRLLDVTREQDRTLAAYTVDGPCVPKRSASGEDSWLLPNKTEFAAQTSHLCLAVIPPPSAAASAHRG